MYGLIVLFSQSFDDKGFTYKIPEDLIDILKIGMVVKVPFGKQETYGVVIEITKILPYEIKNIKEIINIYSNDIFMLYYQIEIHKHICSEYFSLAHQGISLFFPSNLRDKIIKNKFNFTQKKSYKYSFNNSNTLNIKQKEIFDIIEKSNKNEFLLYGVTGSGKTEIYINLIKKYLDLGKQTLLLVPEIILTNQIANRISHIFGDDVIILNSTISQAEKTKIFNDIHQNKAKIIVGTRSALFYPYSDLGLIIIDEEHDNSYISDSAPRYDGIDIAYLLAKHTNSKLVLGSGTPKINHFYDGLKGKYEVLHLFNEYEK